MEHSLFQRRPVGPPTGHAPPTFRIKFSQHDLYKNAYRYIAHLLLRTYSLARAGVCSDVV